MLSVVILNLNTKDLVLECIDSILAEGSSLEKEIIVVDNGSDDGSQDAIKSLRVKNLRLIENPTNVGFSKANNQGIRKSKGEYKLLLNSDTKIRRNSLNKLVRFAEQNKDAGVVGPRLLNPDGSVQPSCYHLPNARGAIYEYWLGKKGFFEKYAPKGKGPVSVEAVVGAAFLITPRGLKRAGLLDERYFLYFEDLDYCRKVLGKGLKVFYLPSAEIIHIHGATVRREDGSKIAQERLVSSSKTYNGLLNHYLINFIIWSGQKWEKIFKHS